MSTRDSSAGTGSGAAGGAESLPPRNEDPEDILDSCLEFMGTYVTKSLRVKYDKWQKLVTSEDTKVSEQRIGMTVV